MNRSFGYLQYMQKTVPKPMVSGLKLFYDHPMSDGLFFSLRSMECVFDGFLFKLTCVQVIIVTFFLHQFVMRTLLDDFAIVYN